MFQDSRFVSRYPLREFSAVFATAAIVAFGAFDLAASRAGADIYVWTGAESDDWFDAGNWDLEGAVPRFAPGCDGVLGVDVQIGGGLGPITVVCSGGGSVALGSLFAGSPLLIATTLTLDGTSILNSPVSTNFFNLIAHAPVTIEGSTGAWDRGTITGTGYIEVTELFGLVGPGNRLLGIDLENLGAVDQISGLTLTSGALGDPGITNHGTWSGSGTLNLNGGSMTSRFVTKAGSIVEGVGNGLLRFQVPVDIEGAALIRAHQGNVRFDRGGMHAGFPDYSVADDRAIVFGTMSGGTPVEITGTAQAFGAGQLQLIAELRVNESGTLVASLDPISSQGMFLDNSALLSVEGVFANAGKMTWKAGTIQGEGGISNGAAGIVDVVGGGNSNPTIGDFTTVVNFGTWRNHATCIVDVGAVLDTTGGGTLHLNSGNLTGTGAVRIRDGSVLGRFFDAPEGFAQITAITEVEDSSIDCFLGEIRLRGGGSMSNVTIVAGRDASVSIRDASYEAAGVQMIGSGDVALGSATLVVPDSKVVTNSLAAPGAFRLGSPGAATLDGPGEFVNQGLFQWVAGSIGLGTVAAEPFGELLIGGFANLGGVVETGGPLPVLSGPYRNIAGTTDIKHALAVQGDGRLRCEGGLVRQIGAAVSLTTAQTTALLGGGTWELFGAANINGPGSFVLENGTLRKTGGGTATVSAPATFTALSAAIEFDVQSGILKLPAIPESALATTKWTIARGAEVHLGGEEFIAGQNPANPFSIIDEIDGVISPSADRLPPPKLMCGVYVNGGRIRPGGADGTGELVLDADLEMLPGGIISINIAGDEPGESHDVLTVTGNATLGGMLRVHVAQEFAPLVGQTFTVVAAGGAVIGNFDTLAGDGLWSVAIVDDAVVLTCLVPPTCAGDVAGNDATIDGADLGLLLANWGPAPSSPADLNGDDFVDGADLGLLLAGWGTCGGVR